MTALRPPGLVLMVLVALSGCATPTGGGACRGGATREPEPAPSEREASMARVGYVGAAVAAVDDGAAAEYMEHQRLELERLFAEDPARRPVQVSLLGDGAIDVRVAGDASFDPGSAQLKAEILAVYARIATVLRAYGNTVAHVVGHAGGEGGDGESQSLSERRAASVTAYLGTLGVPASRLRREGRGQREPVAGDATVEGRRTNDRMDIVIVPVTPGQEQRAWMPPSYLGG